MQIGLIWGGGGGGGGGYPYNHILNNTKSCNQPMKSDWKQNTYKQNSQFA